MKKKVLLICGCFAYYFVINSPQLPLERWPALLCLWLAIIWRQSALDQSEKERRCRHFVVVIDPALPLTSFDYVFKWGRENCFVFLGSVRRPRLSLTVPLKNWCGLNDFTILQLWERSWFPQGEGLPPLDVALDLKRVILLRKSLKCKSLAFLRRHPYWKAI